MSELSPQTKKLIARYQTWRQAQHPKEGVVTVHVDEVAAKVAAFYEKIREVLDWKEEHLMRRAAIERVAKRRLFFMEAEGNIAEALVLELIRGGHFPNDKIEETKIEVVQKIIDKYLFIIQNSPKQAPTPRLKLQLTNWLSGIAACEIEETLSPALRERALIDYMTELMHERIQVRQGIRVTITLGEDEKRKQIYIAVQRALFKLDSPIIAYNLLKMKFGDWPQGPLPLVQDVANNIYGIWQGIEQDLNHALSDKFYQVCEKYDTIYLLFGDIISEEPLAIEEKIAKPPILEDALRKAYNQRLATLKSRLGRAAVYATLSIFFTKIALLLAIEIPFAKYVTGHINLPALGVDVLGPTLLMAGLVATTRPPKKENLTYVIRELMKIVYQRETKDVYEIGIRKKRGALLNFFIGFVYLLSFCLTVGLIVWGLHQLRFSVLSSIIFIIFISLIAFAGARIRERAKELHILDKKENFLNIVLDLFAVPLVRLGKWLSGRWQKYNVISAVFSALIDMPFSLFVEFLEQWRYFLREKKDSIH